MEYHGDKLHAVTLGAGRQAVSGGGGVAGFQARSALVEAHQLVGVGQAELAVAHRVHPDGRVFFDLLMGQKLPGHDGDIPRRRQMLRRVLPVVQAGTVDKMGVFHAQLRRAGVHFLHKGRLTARHMLRQRRGAVVGGADHHAFEHLVHAHLLAHLQIDLAAALGRSGLRGGHHVVPADAPAVQGLHDQQQRHDLRHRSRRQLFIRVFLIEYRSRRRVHQDC